MSLSHKRSSLPEENLMRRTSSFHSAVTLFELPTPKPTDDDAETECPPRRSKRLRTVVRPSSMDDAPANGGAAGMSLDMNEMRGAEARRSSRRHDMNDGGEVIASTSSRTLRSPGLSTSRKRQRDQDVLSPLKKPKATPQSSESAPSAPARWREAYDRIKGMRSRIVAPVDTMGAGAAQLGETVPKNQRFATLVSLMLSSQTKDEVTSAAVRKLREAVGGSLSAEAILAAEDKVISEAICKVGFWRRKTDYIKRTAKRLQYDYSGDIPKTVDELCSLPGVGPKMSILALHVGWKINAGVGVDVHVHRITNRLGWHTPPTKTPEATRLNLQAWLPEDLRPTFTGLLVGFGQTICLPVNPRCDACDLNDGLCPSGSGTTPRSVDDISATTNHGSPSGPLVVIELQS
ncbi:DNA glycosylase [Daedalea quercina L-15889]|uniref:Endonuclease III homolog n=1 Tax=Daedalea quercina L-15889 TaxID=1314783 RepID=A0A165TWT6_9APHY|nr:DNA glycosylase [Daedalea quercina L-15889]